MVNSQLVPIILNASMLKRMKKSSLRRLIKNAQNVGIYKIEIALESEVAEDNFIWDNPPNGIFVGGQN